MLRRLPLALGLVLGVLVFGHALREGSQVFIGTQGVDAWGTQWFYWYVGQQLGAGESLGKTDLLFYPWGKEVYLHTGGNVLDAFLAWPIRWVLGPVAGYNLFVVLLLATNALAARELAKAAGAKDPAAAIAGVLFAFNPFLLCELDGGRPTQVMACFLLLFWTDYLKLQEKPGLRLALWSGLWLALSALTYWYYAIFSGMAAAIFGLVAGRKALPWRVLAGLVSAVIVLPFALPMLTAEEVPGLLDLSRWSLTEWFPDTQEGVSIGIYCLDVLGRSAGFWAEKDDGGLAFLPEATPFAQAQVFLLLLGLFGRGIPRRLLLTLVLVGGLIAIGPHLTDGLTNPFYLAMVTGFRVFRRLWWPQRAMILVQIGLVVASALALNRLFRIRALGVVATLLIALSWYSDLRQADLAPFHFWPSGVPVAYRCLASATDGAIIELPYADTQAHLYYQTRHGRPMFGGMVEDNPVFSPKEQTEFRESNTFISMLIAEAKDPEGNPTFEAEDKAAVGELGYKWVVLDKQAFLPPGFEQARVAAELEGNLPRVRRVFNRLFGAPVYEDTHTVIWAPWGHPSPCGQKTLELAPSTIGPRPKR